MDSKYNLQDVVLCQICDTSVYSMYCNSCLLQLCEICAKEHLSDKPKEHKVLPSKMRKYPPVCSKCPRHPKHLCKYYCRKCCIPVCKVCATVVEHKNHETVDIDKGFENKKSMIKSDLEELQELLSKYRAFLPDILKLKSELNRNFETFTADLKKIKEDPQIKKEIECLKCLEFDYEEKKFKFLDTLGRQKDEITSTISKIEECIPILMEFLNSNEVDFVFSYKTRNAEFKELPQIPPVPMPHFPSQKAIKERFLQSIGSLPKLFATNKRNEFCYEKNILDAESSDSDMLPILDEPRIITCINTMYGDCNQVISVSCIDQKDNLILAECHKGKLNKNQYCMQRTEAQKARSYESPEDLIKIQNTRLRTEAQKARSYESSEDLFKIQNTSSRLEDSGNWLGRTVFPLSFLGYSVGLGTVWRFPYLAYSNGGGAFVFVFVLMFLFLGLPLMFLEFALGQYAALGQSIMFDRLCPLFHGLGYGLISVSGIVSLYHTVIIAWCIWYFIASLNSELPWTKCYPEWATENCYSFKEANHCHQVSGQVYFKQVCYNATVSLEWNLSLQAQNFTRHPPAQDFFERGMLDQSDGIENIGVPQWKIVLSLFFAWLMILTIFATLHKGVKSTRKVVNSTVLFLYVVLIVLFFRGVTLPGAVDGIIYYLTPRFDKLGEAKVWSDAASQILFALGPAWGCLNTLSRYNHFHNNCFRDTLIVGIGNISTSIFAGFVIFSIIGYLAHDLQMPIDKVVDQGAGLAFIVYSHVVTRLPISPLWSILVFGMMIILGMGRQIALLETMMTAVHDTFPQLRVKKNYFVAVVCLIGFLGGLSLTSNGGMHILQLMDNYVSTWSVFFMAGLESVVIGWIYGGGRFIRDIEMMIGVRGKFFHIFFKLFWKFLSPMTLAFVFVFNLIQYKPMEFGDSDHSILSNGIGWIISLVPIILILTMAIIKILKAPKEMNFREKVRFLLKPSHFWGPALKVATCDIHEKDDESL